MRFSMGSALIAVALIAVACAAMTYSNAAWTSGIMSISLALFATMAVRVMVMQGEPRAFALAFTLVGGSYLLLASTTIFRIHEFLITNYVLAWAARVTDVAPGFPPTGGGGFFSVPLDLSIQSVSQFGGGSARLPTLEDIINAAISRAPYSRNLPQFFLSGHCVWSWLFGLLAGWLAPSLFRRSQKTILGKL